jgi:hypothetical protein
MLSNHQYRIFKLETGGHLITRLHHRTQGRRPGYRRHTAAEGMFFCSIFVQTALRWTTRTAFFRTLPVVVPADFAVDPMFTAVPIQWCRITI